MLFTKKPLEKWLASNSNVIKIAIYKISFWLTPGIELYPDSSSNQTPDNGLQGAVSLKSRVGIHVAALPACSPANYHKPFLTSAGSRYRMYHSAPKIRGIKVSS